MLPIKCPECGSPNVRSSLSQNLVEKIARAFGFYTLRCRNCDNRFKRGLWDFFNLVYARCPQCYGLELSLWSPENYRLQLSWKLKLAFGGRPRRCERCRRNFVSFRPCKIRFRRRKPADAASSWRGSTL